MGLSIRRIAQKYQLDESDLLSRARILGLAHGYSIDPSTTYFNKPELQTLLEPFGVLDAPDCDSEPSGPMPGDPIPPDFEVSTDSALERLGLGAPPRHPIWLHAEVLEQLGNVGSDRVGPRTTHVLRRLGLHGRTTTTKGTLGPGKGWRRSPLGGNGGNHYYLWWAPKGTPVLGELGTTLPDRGIVARAVRHHDEMGALDAGNVDAYQPLDSADMLQGDTDLPAPWTEAQLAWARRTETVRVLEGDPGAGKTTCLHLAMALRQGERVLYLTFSERLRDRAREDVAAPTGASGSVEFLTLRELIAALVGTVKADDEAAFVAAAGKLQPKDLGAWRQHLHELFCELRAHAVGAAVPCRRARLARADVPLVADDAFREARVATLGEADANAAIDIARKLGSDGGHFAQRYCASLAAAFEAARLLLDDTAPLTGLAYLRWQRIDRIVVDEVQDLAPVEAAVVIELAARIARTHPERRLPKLLLAGDERQTVRAAGFEWGWLKDLVYERLGVTPQQDTLGSSLRCPRRVAQVLAATGDYYSLLQRPQRPGGSVVREVDDVHQGHVRLCRLESDGELNRLLEELTEADDCAVIDMADADFAPDAVRLSPEAVKGLEFEVAVLLDAGRWLERIHDEAAQAQKGTKSVVPRSLWLRRAIDALRVAVSRTAGDLVFVERPGGSARAAELLDALADAGEAMRVDVEALLGDLVAVEVEADLRLRRYLDRAEDFVEHAPHRAWELAHAAVAALGDVSLPDAIADRDVRHEVRARALAVGVRLLARQSTVDMPRANIAKTCAKWAGAFGFATLGKALVAMSPTSAEGAGPDLDRLRALAAHLASALDEPRLGADLPKLAELLVQQRRELLARFERGLVDRLDQALSHLDALAATLKSFGHAEPVKQAEALRAEVALALRRAGQLKEALRAYATMDNPPLRDRADIRELTGNYSHAAADFEETEAYDDALRCWRKANNGEEARRLAQLARLPEVERLLNWHSNVEFLLRTKPPGDLTVAEATALRRAFEKALGGGSK